MIDLLYVRKIEKTITNLSIISFKKIRNCKVSIDNNNNINNFISKFKKRNKIAKVFEFVENFVELTIFQELVSTTNTDVFRKHIVIIKKKIVIYNFSTSTKECFETDYIFLLAKDKKNKI